MTLDLAGQLLAAVRERAGENFDLYEAHVNPGFSKALRLAGFARRFVRAEGCWLFDDHGRRYLDAVAGYGALNLGHAHPDVVAALHGVIDAGIPTFTQVEAGILPALAAERLLHDAPGNYSKALFVNSGSEAVDLALRLARAATGRKLIVSLEGGFHGSTLGTLGLGGQARKHRYRPFVAGLSIVGREDRASLDALLSGRTVAAVVLEAVQGEGGIVALDTDFLVFLARRCRETGTLLVADEVQTGFGKTGRWFFCEHDGVVPDIMTMVSSREIMSLGLLA